MNVAGFLAIHRFVSHVTGFSAHFAFEFQEQHFLQALYALLIPLSFLMGSCFSAFFTEKRRQERSAPAYQVVLLVIAGFFLVIAISGELGLFGTFGEPFVAFRDFVLLLILTFCCGAQNALISRYSQSVIRTTHLTGITTDLGIGMIRHYFQNDQNERKMNWIRINLIISFMIGSLLSVYIFSHFKFSGFFLPAVISSFLAVKLTSFKEVFGS